MLLSETHETLCRVSNESIQEFKVKVWIPPIHLVTTSHKKGSKWANSKIHVLPEHLKQTLPEDGLVKVAIFEKFPTHAHISDAISFGESGHFWLEAKVSGGQVVFQNPRIFKTRNEHLTQPIFVLLFMHNDAVVAISESFHCRSRWGTERKDTKNIFCEVQKIGRTIPESNQQLINLIDEIKSELRVEEQEKKKKLKVEKACWLQHRILSDAEVVYDLPGQLGKYLKTEKFQTTECIVKEISSRVEALRQAQVSHTLRCVPDVQSIEFWKPDFSDFPDDIQQLFSDCQLELDGAPEPSKRRKLSTSFEIPNSLQLSGSFLFQ